MTAVRVGAENGEVTLSGDAPDLRPAENPRGVRGMHNELRLRQTVQGEQR